MIKNIILIDLSLSHQELEQFTATVGFSVEREIEGERGEKEGEYYGDLLWGTFLYSCLPVSMNPHHNKYHIISLYIKEGFLLSQVCEQGRHVRNSRAPVATRVF